MPIHFGTDGWRAVISDEFTFENVRHVAQALADWLNEAPGGPEGRENPRRKDPSALRVPFDSPAPSRFSSPSIPTAVVGFDTRFLSDRYAIEVAQVLAGNGIHVYLTRADCPTPALSYAVRELNADCGVMVTASHNPPRYNGIKLKAAYGGSVLPVTTKQVEEQLQRNLAQRRMPTSSELPDALNAGLIQRFDPQPAYLAHLESLIDKSAIAAHCPRILIDPMYGSGRGYIRSFLERMGCQAQEMHGEMNPGFGGLHPEPIGRNLRALIEAVQAGEYDVGLATDGDADRIGAIDATGQFVTPHLIYALVLRHLVEERGWRGAVVKTVSTTQLVNRLAERYDLTLHETPVGSNHLCELILTEDVLIAGEESGGITIKNHIPESDGILMGLLVTEIMAHHQQPIHEIIVDLLADLGPVAYARDDVRTQQPFSKPDLVQRLMDNSPKELAGRPVLHVSGADGVKYTLADGSWLLIRPSGTEPVLRIYAEATDNSGVQALLRAGAALAGV